MSPDGPPGERDIADFPGRGSRSDGASATLPPAVILAICDRLLGEVGRRRHVFGWLRPPGSTSEQWLPVDAYYPGKRVVIICQSSPSQYDDLYRSAIPQHGLRLLDISPPELGTDRVGVELALRRRIAGLAPSPRPQGSAPPRISRMRAAPSEREQQPKPQREKPPRRRAQREPKPPRAPRPRRSVGSLANVLASLAAPARHEPRRSRRGTSQAEAALRASRFIAARREQMVYKPLSLQAPAGRPMPAVTLPSGRPLRPGWAPPARPARTRPGRAQRTRSGAPADGSGQTVGAAVLIVLAGILAAEVYLDVVEVAIGSGLVLLAFGITLDSCARALAAIGAARAGRIGWAWAYALGGTPVIAASPLLRRPAPVSVDPAPLGVLLSLLAAGVVTIALLALLLAG